MRIKLFEEYKQIDPYWEISYQESLDEWTRGDKSTYDAMSRREMDFIMTEFPREKSTSYSWLISDKPSSFYNSKTRERGDVTFISHFHPENYIYGITTRFDNTNICVTKHLDEYFHVIITRYDDMRYHIRYSERDAVENKYRYFICDQFDGLMKLVSDFWEGKIYK